MVDEEGARVLDGSSVVTPPGIVPVRAAVEHSGFERETEKQLSVKEVLHTYAERRHLIGVLERARILFDPKSLPGVTPEESLDFLIKGLKSDDPEKLRQILGPNKEVAQNIRKNFPEFIEYMHQQNDNQTVAEIWKTADADPFTKIALQWEIQRPKQPAGTYIGNYDRFVEESARPVADDLRKLDTLLKSLNGIEILIEIDDWHNGISFLGLTTADGRGIDSVQSTDPNTPYRDVVLGSQAASTGDTHNPTHISVTERLIIPFEARKVLRTKDPRDWDRADEFWRISRYHVPFDPANNFPAIIMGEELIRLRKEDGGGLDVRYNVLKKAIEGSA